MSIVFEVNSIACSACGDAIKNAIVSHEPTATVEIDIDKKISIGGWTDRPTHFKAAYYRHWPYSPIEAYFQSAIGIAPQVRLFKPLIIG